MYFVVTSFSTLEYGYCVLIISMMTILMLVRNGMDLIRRWRDCFVIAIDGTFGVVDVVTNYLIEVGSGLLMSGMDGDLPRCENIMERVSCRWGEK